jgi:hypothetical protein
MRSNVLESTDVMAIVLKEVPLREHQLATTCKVWSECWRRAKRSGTRHVSVVDSGFRGAEERNALRQHVRELGGEHHYQWQPSTTHVIMWSSTAGERTLKYLRGVVSGTWVVHAGWLAASVAAGFWVAEHEFEVVADVTCGDARPGAARKLRLRREAAHAPLLAGWQCVLGELPPAVRAISRDFMERLGATVDDCSAVPCDHWSRSSAARKLALTSKDASTLPLSKLRLADEVPIVTEHWLFDTISHGALQPLEDYLVAAEPGRES